MLHHLQSFLMMENIFYLVILFYIQMLDKSLLYLLYILIQKSQILLVLQVHKYYLNKMFDRNFLNYKNLKIMLIKMVLLQHLNHDHLLLSLLLKYNNKHLNIVNLLNNLYLKINYLILILNQYLNQLFFHQYLEILFNLQ